MVTCVNNLLGHTVRKPLMMMSVPFLAASVYICTKAELFKISAPASEKLVLVLISLQTLYAKLATMCSKGTTLLASLTVLSL